MLPVLAVEGRVVGEVAFKHSTSGTPMASFRIKAADRKKNEETGKWEDVKVLWLTVRAFGALAQNAAESLREGDQVVAIGKLSTAQWVDADGNQRTAPEFVASSIGPGVQFAPRRHHDTTGREVAPAAPATDGHDPWA